MNFNNDNSSQLSNIAIQSTANNFIGIVYSNVLNSYQPKLISSTTLYGIGSNLTLINYNNLSNLPNLSIYDLITDRQTAITNLSNTLQTNINTKQATLTTSTTLAGIGSNLTLINYANITGTPSLNYLPLAGGALTGNLSTNSQITGFTTLNGTTGIFGTLSTSNNTNMGAPGIGTLGATNGGDKLILWNGTSTAYPYSLGIENSGLWYSVPSGANHKFYNNGVNTLIINSSGNVGIGTNSTNYLLDIYSDNASSNIYTRVRANVAREAGIILDRSGTTWTIFNKGTGFTSANNLSFQSTSTTSILEITQSGNIGIGTTNPNNILQVGNAGRLRIANDSNDYSLIGTLDTDGNSNTRIVIYGYTNTGNIGDIAYVATTGTHIFYTSATERMRILNNGNVGIGTSVNINGKLTLYSTNTSLPRITLTGTEYYTGGGPLTSTDGVALMLGINRPTVKSIFMCDTSLLTQNTSNPMIKFAIYNTPSSCAIDASATDGLTRLPLLICGSTTFAANGTVGIGTNNPNAILELYSTTQLNTRLILSGQEFYQSYSTNLNNAQLTGIALLCGVNRPTNKQLWIGDSALTAQNSTNGIIRIMPNGGYIDACSTNGTVLPLTLGNSGSQTTIYGSTINLSGMCSVNNNLNVGNGYYIDFSGGAGDGKIYRPDGNLRIEIDDIINFKSTFANNTIVFNQGAVSIPTTLSCGQFSTSSYNNLVMKTIFINPYSSIGGPYNNGYWLIDVYDYSSQYGFVYLFLNINSPSLLYWLGRVVIANSSSFNTYADMGYNVQLGLTTLNSRLQIIISCPSGTNNGLAQLCVKIIG